MAIAGHLTQEYGKWVCAVPIKRLVLTQAVGEEFKVIRVRFVAPKKLPRIRGRLGFPFRISSLKRKHKGIFEPVLSDGHAIGIQLLTGKGGDKAIEFLRTVRDELAILSLSQLGVRKRKNNAAPSLADETPLGYRSFLVMDTSRDRWTQPSSLVGRFNDLVLDDLWVDVMRKGFFFNLLEILRGETKVSREWRQDITNAAILAGQSQMTTDLPQAFLWNMISIELLLTKERDKYTDSLPKRAEAFLGWTYDWKLGDYSRRIRDLYSKRCDLVHKGDRAGIKVGDVHFSDHLLFNVLNNIVKHPGIFYSKEQVAGFSERVLAEKVLGVKPKVRPRTLSFWHLTAAPEDIGQA